MISILLTISIFGTVFSGPGGKPVFITATTLPFTTSLYNENQETFCYYYFNKVTTIENPQVTLDPMSTPLIILENDSISCLLGITSVTEISHSDSNDNLPYILIDYTDDGDQRSLTYQKLSKKSQYSHFFCLKIQSTVDTITVSPSITTIDGQNHKMFISLVGKPKIQNINGVDQKMQPEEKFPEFEDHLDSETWTNTGNNKVSDLKLINERLEEITIPFKNNFKKNVCYEVQKNMEAKIFFKESSIEVQILSEGYWGYIII